MGKAKSMSKYIKKEYVIHCFAFVLIGILCCINIRKLDYIAVLNDEFGYWGNAATIVGYDWKDLIAETPYYSMGYSLWLVPIMYLFSTPEMWYKIAILMNVFFLQLSYCLCYALGVRLWNEKPRNLIALVSILVIVFPSNITYAQVAWSESLLYFLTWIITYFFVKLDEKFSLSSFLGILLLSIYSYCVHTRNIGVMAVVAVCLALILKKYGKSVKFLVGMIIVLTVGIWCVKEIKSYQISSFWGNSNFSNMNNIGLNGKTFIKYYQKLFGNLRLFVESLGGKFVYLLFGTGLTCTIAVVGFLKDIIVNIKIKHIFSNYWISKLWCIGIAGVMWISSSLQMIDWTTRKDIIVYARYMEHTLGPLLLLGMMYLLSDGKAFRKTMLISIGLFLVGLRSVYLRVYGAEGYFNSICSPIIGAFYDNISDIRKAFICIGGVGILFFLTLFGGSYLKNRSNKRIIVVAVFIIIYCIIGYESGTYMDGARSKFVSQTLPVRDEIVKYDDVEIIYIKDTDADVYSTNPKYLQFMIPERKIEVVESIEDVSKVHKKILLLVNPEDIDTIQYIEGNAKGECAVSTPKLKLYNIY